LILTSMDGVSWSQWSDGNACLSRSYLYDVTYGEGVFVAVGRRDLGSGRGPLTILTSSDGSHWAEQSETLGGGLFGVSYGNGLFVAVGCIGLDCEGTILTSPDGYRWTPRSAGTNAPLNSIAYGNGVFVAVSNGISVSPGRFSTPVLASPDGISWDTQTVQLPGEFNHIFFGNGIFVAIGGSDCGGADGGGYGMFTSPDLMKWTRRLSNSYCFSGLTFGNGSFIVVGDGGTILQSGTPVQFQPTASTRLGDGTMRLVLGAEMGAELLLEASTNLVDWARLTTLTNTLGTSTYLDLDATNFNQRFYRAKHISQ